MPTLPLAPPMLARGVDALDGLCALLACADEQAWRSLARPKAHALAALAYTVHAELTVALSELVQLPEETAAAAQGMHRVA